MAGKNSSAPIPVFDFGGVLFDWDPRHLFRHFFDGDSEGLERFLTEIDFQNWNADLDRGRPFAEAVAERSSRFPRYAHLIRAFDERWEETINGPTPGMEDILRRLRHRDIGLYGLSNLSGEKFPLLHRRHPEITGLFADILLSGEVGLIKPDSKIFNRFVTLTGLRPERLLLIDDSEANLSAARNLGWDAVRFVSAERLEEEFVRRGLL
ncbi:MAG: HAD family phosphatase [Anaerolineales bacterium]|nr:HAD family phosphatase [Anaerolineales bacterium]